MSGEPNYGKELAEAGVRVSPAIAVAVTDASGITLEQWVFILTIVYLLLQIGMVLLKAFRAWRTQMLADANRAARLRWPEDE